MALFEIRKEPARWELACFGALFAAFFGIIGLIAHFRFDAPRFAIGAWAVGGLVCAVYYALPRSRRAIYRAWICLVSPIGWALSLVILAIVYFVVVTPIGLFMRLIGHDPLSRRRSREATTYWSERPPAAKSERYFHQY